MYLYHLNLVEGQGFQGSCLALFACTLLSQPVTLALLLGWYPGKHIFILHTFHWVRPFLPFPVSVLVTSFYCPSPRFLTLAGDINKPTLPWPSFLRADKYFYLAYSVTHGPIPLLARSPFYLAAITF